MQSTSLNNYEVDMHTILYTCTYVCMHACLYISLYIYRYVLNVWYGAGIVAHHAYCVPNVTLAYISLRYYTTEIFGMVHSSNQYVPLNFLVKRIMKL